MRCPPSLLMLAIVASLAAVQAVAQPDGKPPKPYPIVAITAAAASDDVTLAAFRIEVAVVAKSRIYSALARVVQSRGLLLGPRFRPQL